jgi:hypothetical protein
MQLCEPFAVIDTFVSGVGRIEKLKGGNVRFTFYVESQHDGVTEWVVVAKIVMCSEEAVSMLRH